MTDILIAISLGYFFGSIPFSFLIAKNLVGIDLRFFGDKNVGASNVVRAAGRKAGAFAFCGDVLKGIVPILICQYGLKFSFPLLVISGLSAIIGHNEPIFLKFKGGKGMSTAIGVITMLAPIESAILLIPFFLIYFFLKKAIISAVIVSFLLPLICYFLKKPLEVILGLIIILVFCYINSSGNIKKIIKQLWVKS